MKSAVIEESGRERGIRTPGGVTLNGFQDRRFRPLSHLPSIIFKFAFGGDIRIRTGDQGFAGPCLTAWLCRLELWCPRPDLNRHGRKIPRDFKSLVSTNSTTRAKKEVWSGKRDSNSRPQPWQGCALPLSYSRKN